MDRSGRVRSALLRRDRQPRDRSATASFPINSGAGLLDFRDDGTESAVARGSWACFQNPGRTLGDLTVLLGRAAGHADGAH